MGKAPQPKRGKKSGKPVAVPTYAEARDTVKEGIEKHGQAENTNNNYAGHIRRGREFLESFATEQAEAETLWNAGRNSRNDPTAEGDCEIPLYYEDDDEMGPEFRTAFTGPPVKCTPMAIATFLAHKCMVEECGKSTASQIHASFLKHYDRLAGDTYRGRWCFHDAHKRWEGNPVRSAVVIDMLAACQNKDGEGERNHSRAMSMEDMRKLHKASQRDCPVLDESRSYAEQADVIAQRGTHLLFNALSSSGWTIWMRYVEATSLKYKNFMFRGNRRRPTREDLGESQKPHSFTLNLRDRKNWQNRLKKGEHQMRGHLYGVYAQLDKPEVDMYTHLLDWLDFYEQVLLGRPLGPEDYVFPTIGVNGMSVQPDRPMSAAVAQKKIIEMAKKAGIDGAEGYTTHCYRRGGAQYRFIYGPLGERWHMNRIRWWGGWAPGEHRDTLMRYLLDELHTYEEDHSDALCPINQKAINDLPPAAAAGLYEMRELARTVEAGLNECRNVLQSSMKPPTYHPCSGRTESTSIPLPHKNLIPVPFRQEMSQPQLNQQSVAPPLQVRKEHIHLIPGLTQRLSSKAWEQVVKDWEHADPSRSLYVAMKDWDPQWHKDTRQTQKFGQRQRVALEFINFYNRDAARFTAAYPGHTRGFSPLLAEVRAAQQLRGDCEIHPTRRKDFNE
ncbi:hypothetical protein GALMADRAFT_75054 [Galerina marginata CBS 339.88]|uniref:Uncharacterized protein n=1 Tax=Galerina marginata (strain CBS 339.88) TaxID=685588 RepID=A0A067SL78_GALM3|nr:hypothetical protein GALMADRAFT_75054 [Galerina marginata CBS 339.88]